MSLPRAAVAAAAATGSVFACLEKPPGWTQRDAVHQVESARWTKPCFKDENLNLTVLCSTVAAKVCTTRPPGSSVESVAVVRSVRSVALLLL